MSTALEFARFNAFTGTVWAAYFAFHAIV